MSELIIEILVYLSAAALIGLLLGYAVWGWGQAARISDARADGAASARTSVDGDAGLRTQLNACIKERKRLEAEVERLGKTILDLRQSRPVPQAAPPVAPVSAQAAPRDNTDDGVQDGLQDAIIGDEGTADQAPPPGPPPAPPSSLLTEAPDTFDDLKKIKGVGKIMERVLNSKGIFLFHQLANFSDDDIAWVNAAIDAFPGRIERDDWVGQAKDLYRKKYGKPHTEADV